MDLLIYMSVIIKHSFRIQIVLELEFTWVGGGWGRRKKTLGDRNCTISSALRLAKNTDCHCGPFKSSTISARFFSSQFRGTVNREECKGQKR